MRCLALAQAFRAAGAQCRFICRELPESLAALVRAAGHGLTILPGDFEAAADADATLGAIDEQKDLLVVDHYGIGASWERVLRRRAHRILAIDDLADREHDCDLLIDQNLYTDLESRYDGKLPEACRRLLGPKFALLREEFAAARANVTTRSGDVRRLLIFFGGMDDADCTSAAVEAAARVLPPGTAVDVVIGAEHRRLQPLKERCATLGHTLHIQTSRMAALMAAADFALGAGGSASWERCCLGLPALVVVVAENQRALANDAARAGLLFAPAFADFSAASFEHHLRAVLADAAGLRAMSERAFAAVDGQGVRRVVRAAGMSPVVMRSAGPPDARDLFEWRNDPSVRQVSRNPAPIPWEAHQAWFAAVLTDPDRPLLLGELAGQALGVVRFDIERDTAEVSIYKVPRNSGPGSGGDLLAAAEGWLRQHRPDVRNVVAEVLGDNRASHGLFTAAGYRSEAGSDARRYTKRMFP